MEECDHSKLRNLISRACFALAERDSKNADIFFFFSSRSSPNGRPWSQVFLEEILDTGDKNHDDFSCMQMSLLMSMRSIFGDDTCKLITFFAV